jgi:LuxR family maltose regulon positive regulatory protein
MVENLLATKLRVPGTTADVVPRPRLVDRVKDGLRGRLTLLSAPAGFGKTTVLVEALRSMDTLAAWLSLDEQDDDLTTFWSYFVGALQTIRRGTGEAALAVLQTNDARSVMGILGGLINELTELKTDMAVVVDDYQVIQDLEIHQSLQFLLEHCPDNLHLAISSRSDPPIPLARLRAQGKMQEIRTDDLRFTSDEAAQFLNDVMALDISADDLDVLNTRAEGWISSLRLAAFSLAKTANRTQFIEAFGGSNRYVLDYLIEEVLSRQDEATRSFLLQTCILDRLSAPLCNAVTAREDGQQVLERLEANNLFVIPLDEQRDWYRYHRLFAELLNHQIRKTKPQEIPVLHSRASSWCQDHGLPSAAIDHAVAASDHTRAIQLIEPIAQDLIHDSRSPTLLSWLTRLPEGLIGDSPRLCVYRAWAQAITGRVAEAETFLDSFESHLKTLESGSQGIGDEYARFVDDVEVMRAYIALKRGEYRDALAWCQRAIATEPDADLQVRVVIASVQGLANLMTGDIDKAIRQLEKTCELGTPAKMHFSVLMAKGHLGDAQAHMGRLHRAITIYEQTIRLGVERGRGYPMTVVGYAYVGLGQVLYEWNEIAEAKGYLLRGSELGRQTEEWPIVLRAYLAIARIEQIEGRKSEADATLAKAREIVPLATMAWEARNTDDSQARIRLARGDVDGARRLMTAQMGMGSCAGPGFSMESRLLTSAAVRIASGEQEVASGILDELLQDPLNESHARIRIEGWALKGIALYASGDRQGAVSAIQNALTIGKEGGFVRTFADHGDPMAAVLRLALSHGIETEYVTRLLDAFDYPKEDGDGTLLEPLPNPSVAARQLIQPLTRREMEVLACIATGMSNRQIAESLILEESTVKTHINNIYGKLGVGSRTQAIARAGELHLPT